MKRKCSLLLLSLLLFVNLVNAQQIQERLAVMPGVSGIEKLESQHYPEKYVLRISQPVDHQNPSAGTFNQRVIVAHVGYDRPTVMVTEGYGGAYAMTPRYQEELSKLLNANLIFVEHRYFLESTPESCDWDYLTVENSVNDLHRINTAFKEIYNGKWITTGISKGGQTTCLYRAYFPDDVDFSVPYVAPLNRGTEDGRHEVFLRKVGTRKERKQIEAYQKELFKRKAEIIPLLTEFCRANKLQHRISIPELFDYCVLEYPFALWQWGSDRSLMPSADAETHQLFDHLMKVSGPDYFADNQPNVSFFVQAARELGYYGYDTRPFKKYLTIKSARNYLDHLMLPAELIGKVDYRPESSRKVYDFLKENDPKMIFIYGEADPWTASRVPDFKGKANQQIYIQPEGSHAARIQTMPEEIKQQILAQMDAWLEE
ncbi:MAG: S28 family serine protease [Bacteroidales bacterium]